jgi:hypothetical protein
MYEAAPGWAQLAAGDILVAPASGVVVVSHRRSVDWATPLRDAFESRGAELPVCGLTHSGEVLAGTDPAEFPPGPGVVIINDITTTGMGLAHMRLRLVLRLPGGYHGVPYRASIHFPLPLTPASSCFECLLGRPLFDLAS